MGRQESKSRNQKESQTLHENEEKQERKRYKKIQALQVRNTETGTVSLPPLHKYHHRSGGLRRLVPTKQKRFWNCIKSLRKDNTGISPLKDKTDYSTTQRTRPTFSTDNMYQYILMKIKTKFPVLQAHLFLTWTPYK